MPSQQRSRRDGCRHAAAGAGGGREPRRAPLRGGVRTIRSSTPMAVVLLHVAISLMATSSGPRTWVCHAFLHPSGPLGRRLAPLARGIIKENARLAMPSWRRSDFNLAAPKARPSGRVTSLAMVALPSVAGSSLVNPQVVSASMKAVAELLSCCVLGFVAAKRGILSPANVGALSKIVYGIFLPSLLMVNVAKTCVSQPMGSLLPIPVFAAVQIGVGIVATTLAMRVLKIDPNTEGGRATKVCGSFQNSGILPLIFINALFRGSPEQLTRGIAYVSFYLMGWSPAFWTVGKSFVTGHLDDAKKKEDKGDLTDAGTPKQRSISAKKLVANVRSFAGGSTAKSIFSPPIVACLVGLVIGLSPPLRWLLMRPGAPLEPLWAAFTNLTVAYTPSGILVLAGSLANCPPGEWFSKETRKTLLAVGTARWLFLPAITSALLFGGVKYGLVPRDPMLLFVLLLESAMPSAQNSVIMLQVAGLQDAAGRCARTLCTIYLLSIIPLSILLTAFISALSLA
ncbi:unnamed protein product [Ascophyllum nodosum]